MLERIKTLLGITDTLQDELLSVIVDNVSNHLELMLGKEVPQKLEFVVVEVSIKRFNRVGVEGMKSEWIEGHKTEFYDSQDDFIPYNSLIETNKVDDGYSKRGRVMFI